MTGFHINHIVKFESIIMTSKPVTSHHMGMGN
jgi:hypothetical protein